MSKIMYQNVCCTFRGVVLLIKLIAFLMFLLPLPLQLLKLPFIEAAISNTKKVLEMSGAQASYCSSEHLNFEGVAGKWHLVIYLVNCLPKICSSFQPHPYGYVPL